MTAEFDYRGHFVTMSNGAAETMEEGWLRALLASQWASTDIGAEVAQFLSKKINESVPGTCGFDIDEGPFEATAARRILGALVERFALESFDVLQGKLGHPSIDFLRQLSPSLKLRWMSFHERVHELVRQSLDESIPAFLLPCDQRTRAALNAELCEHHIHFRYEFRSGGRHELRPDVELSLRRKFCRLATSVPEFFERQELLKAHYELADLEERLGLFSDAATTTRKAAQYETTEEGRAIAMELAALRDALGQR